MHQLTDSILPVVDRLAGFKWYSPEDVWRKTRRLSLMMTVIIQKWIYNDKTFRQRTIHPWRMKLAMQKTLPQDKCKYFNFIPSEVQNFVQITTAITYDHKEKSLSISNSGPEAKEYTHLYCRDCKKVLIPKILEAPWDAWRGEMQHSSAWSISGTFRKYQKTRLILLVAFYHGIHPTLLDQVQEDLSIIQKNMLM